MSRLLSHRGPDDLGFLGYQPGAVARASRAASEAIGPGASVGLAHRRLSILDPSERGWQPMSSESGHHWIVYNGEVYNFVELRSCLERLGHEFHSHSDTEVVIAAYKEWGVDAFARFDGMFAFAILDTVQRRIVLARDLFGIKPLYYRNGSDSITFASEIKALHVAYNGGRSLNAQALFKYLRFGVTDEGKETLIQGVRHVPPGTVLEVDLDTRTVGTPKNFGELDVPDRSDLPFDKAASAVREAFLSSVERHLRSDVEVGACLSGGVDSSACVSAMRILRGDSLDLHTFSYVASDPQISEERWIDLVRERSGSVGRKIRPDPADLPAQLDRLIVAQDEPFRSTSIYAQFRVFELVNQAGIKVVLDGQGADEILGGYVSHVAARIADLLRQGSLFDAFRIWDAVRRDAGSGALTGLIVDHFTGGSLKRLLRRIGKRRLVPRWIESGWLDDMGVEPSTYYDQSSGDFREQLRFRLQRTLPALLRYEDRNSMQFSVESRVPFLTRDFVELVLSLSPEHIIGRGGETKSVFRAAMRGIVPDEILNRTDKVGFSTPEVSWLLGARSWVAEILASEAARSTPILRTEELQREWRTIQKHPDRYHEGVWRCINLIRWQQLTDVSF